MPVKYRLLATLLWTSYALLAGMGTIAWAQQTKTAKKGKSPPTPVVTAAVQSHRLSSSIRLPGSVETIRKTQVASPIAGLVTEVLVRDGDRIEKGQVLARLSTDALEARHDTLEAQLLESRARLRAAESKVTRAEELFAANVIAAEQLDDSRFEVDALNARWASLTPNSTSASDRA